MQFFKKRHLLITAAFCGIFMISSAWGQTRLSIGQRTGQSGGSLSTPIEIASEDGLVGLQMDLDFDAGAVDITGITPETFATDHTLRSELVESGKRRLLIYSPTNAELDNQVIGDAELSLLSGYSGGAAFTFSQLRFVDETGTVLNLSLAPFVRLESPVAQSSLDELSTVTLNSVAFETQGNVTHVEFLVDGRIIATDTRSPYSASWQVDTIGNTMLSAIAYDADGDSSPSPQTLVSVQASELLQTWREANFNESERTDGSISGLVADPDGDRIMNFLEYAFGLDPRKADHSGLPQSSIETIGDQQFLTLQYEKPESLQTLNYVFEVSDDLVNWVNTTDSVVKESLGVDGGKERVRGQLVAPIISDSPQKQFIRIRVEFPEQGINGNNSSTN